MWSQSDVFGYIQQLIVYVGVLFGRPNILAYLARVTILDARFLSSCNPTRSEHLGVMMYVPRVGVQHELQQSRAQLLMIALLPYSLPWRVPLRPYTLWQAMEATRIRTAKARVQHLVLCCHSRAF